MVPQCGYHFTEKGLIGGAHANGVEVYPTIGGETMSDEFVAIASDPEVRTTVSWAMVLNFVSLMSGSYLTNLFVLHSSHRMLY